MKNEERLYLRYAFNDLIKNKGVNAALSTILILSAFLMATGSMVIERLAGSISQLSAQAEPPDFLQMHLGEYDEAALERFASEHAAEIDAWLVDEMLGFDSTSLSWARPDTGEYGDLAASRIETTSSSRRTRSSTSWSTRRAVSSSPPRGRCTSRSSTRSSTACRRGTS